MVLPGRIFGRMLLFLTLVFTLLGATNVLAVVSNSYGTYSISGTVTNSTGKTGRIYITAFTGDEGPGVSISAAGAFTITGVSPGTYTVQAFLDNQGNGVRHANDPAGSTQVIVNGADANNVQLSLSNPQPVSPPAPQMVAYRGSNGNFLLWKGATDNSTGIELPIADKYRVVWSTNQGASEAGSAFVASGDNDFFAHVGGLSTYYYKVEAWVGASAAAATSWSPVTPTTGVTVTGTVDLSAVSATGPLLVALADQSGQVPVFCTTLIANPAGLQSYTVNNVPPGTYRVYAIIDMNNDGALDYGDIQQLHADRTAPVITVASNSLAVPGVITLSPANAAATVTTNYSQSAGGSWLNLTLKLAGMQKQPVNVSVAGPSIPTMTIGMSHWNEFSMGGLSPSSPVNVGDTYTFTVNYSDNSIETINTTISAILSSYPSPVSPVGAVPYAGNATPTFVWSAPAVLPTPPYSYQIWVGDNKGQVWNPEGTIPSATTTLTYNYDNTASQGTLIDGNTYNWSISVVDANGNVGSYQTQFTPTSQPAITGFSPASADPGGTVTIHGINFDPVAANNSVTFGGAITVTAASATTDTLTAVVPANAQNGQLTVTVAGKSPVTSTQLFYVGNTISFAGKVLDSSNAPVAGAAITLDEYPLVTTTTAADGTFTLPGLPGNNTQFRLVITKNGYLPVYTDYMASFGSNLDYRSMPYYLYTGSELGLGLGKSAVFVRVLNSLDYSAVSGVTATTISSRYPSSPYSVEYLNSATGSFTGTATDASGIFRVLNLDANDYVTLILAKSGWSFSTPSFNAPGDTVLELGVLGSPPAIPAISSFSPTKAKVGTQVTIFGSNFGPLPSDNTVKFNGVTASVVSASGGQLTVTVPQGATTGQVTVTTIGGTATSAGTFTVQNTLSVTIAGTGSGAVNSISSNVPFSCSGGTCPADFDAGTSLTLFATPSSGSLFTGWSGACTGTGDCLLTLNSDQTVTATFDTIPNVQMGSTYYGTLLDAYTAALTGATIKSQAITFPALDLNRAIAVILAGGYDTSLNSVTGYTTISGLTISLGSATVDKIAVQ